jgi:hypothetical protein
MNERPAIDLPRLRHLLLQMRLWLCGMVLWLSEVSGVRLPKDMRADLLRDFHEARRTALMIMVVHAAALERGRARTPVQAHSGTIAGAPEGFRHQAHRGSDFRGFVRGIRIGGRSLRERHARLQAVIDDFDAHVARFARRLRGSKMKAPVLVFAVAAPCAGLCAPAAIAQDSS